MTAISESEVQMLQKEVDALKKEISELRRKLNESAYERLRQSSTAVEESYIPNLRVNDELTLDSKAEPSQILSINDRLNGITFSNIRKTFVTTTQQQLAVECRALDLRFHVACDLSYEPDSSIHVLSLETTFQDSSLEEITHFINSCHRERNIQELLSGLVQYSTLRKLRETVLTWLCNSCPSALRVNYSVEDGVHSIKICDKANDDPYLTCTWNIDWDKKKHVMRQFFKILGHRDDLQPELQKYLESLCGEPSCETEEMKNVWKKIVDSLQNQTEME